MTRLLIIFSGTWLAFGSASGQPQDAPKRSVQSAAEQKLVDSGASGSPVAANDPDYKIGTQDVLTISVWKEPEMSRTVPVRPDGKISLPLLNDVQAAGLTPMQLNATITSELKPYVNSPQVTVIVAEINSRRIFITGEVLRTGAYPLLSEMTVVQALSNCGGFTQFANLKRIYVLRTQGGKRVKIPINYRAALSGKKVEEDIPLLPGDTIVVP